MFLPFIRMCALHWPWQGRTNKPNDIQASSTRFYAMWDAVARFAAEIRSSDFTAEMIRRRDAYGSEGAMGAIDCATLYGLTRWLRPTVIVESGGYIGMSSAFIL
jgi:predicted O-methyltransferase YrrM